VIIHNAWQLDFNLDCKAFDKHIAATRRIVLLAAESNARVLLASSISVAGAWSAEQGAFPEDIQSTPDAALGGGYGESKWVAEQILEAARERGLETSALRLGQIDGANGNGAWSTSDWVPMMIKSSIPLEALPESKGVRIHSSGTLSSALTVTEQVVSWISPLTVAKAFTEASLATKAPPAGMNVCHDSPVPWKQVMDDVAAALVDQGITKKKLPTVSLDDWMARLEERAEKGDAKELDAIVSIRLDAHSI
jgi:thioester reductase-like protein